MTMTGPSSPKKACMVSPPLMTIVVSRLGMHSTGYIYHKSKSCYTSVQYLAITVLLFRAKKAHVVSKRLDDFRERTQPQLGKVHDPIAETLNVDDNHTFGVMVKADDFSESCIHA